MNSKNRSLQVLLVVVLLAAFSLSGCALSEYLSHLNITPTTIPTPNLPTATPPDPTRPPSLPVSSATPAATEPPASTATPTPTDLPTATVTATLAACAETVGNIQQYQVPSGALGINLPTTVYLPPCYDPQGYYPVLYLLHGQAQDDRYWIDLGVAGIADEAINNGMTPFIMVFPFEERNFDDNTTSKFPDAILYDLIPWVESNFAVCPDRSCRAVGGISRGGGWAIKLAMRNFDLFGSLGGHSFGLMIGDTYYIEKNLQIHTVDEFPRIYLDRGDKDMLSKDIDYFERTLSDFQVPHIFNIYPGDHTRSYWAAHVKEYMDFYMAAWASSPPQP